MGHMYWSYYTIGEYVQEMVQSVFSRSLFSVLLRCEVYLDYSSVEAEIREGAWKEITGALKNFSEEQLLSYECLFGDSTYEECTPWHFMVPLTPVFFE